MRVEGPFNLGIWLICCSDVGINMEDSWSCQNMAGEGEVALSSFLRVVTAKAGKSANAQLQGLKLHHEKQCAAGTPIMAGKQLVQTKGVIWRWLPEKMTAKDRHVRSRVCRTNQKEHLK